MSPRLGASPTLSQRGTDWSPLGESPGQRTNSPPPVGTDSTKTSERGAPVVRELRQLLTVREVAARLAVSRATVYGLIDRGELERVWVVTSLRVTAASFEALLRRSES